MGIIRKPRLIMEILRDSQKFSENTQKLMTTKKKVDH